MAAAAITASSDSPGSWPGADLFGASAVTRFDITIEASDLKSLREEPRNFVPARLAADNVVFKNVALHLKGSVGSFRSIDDKPGFTLDFCRFENGRKFHDLRRIHLNNSVEDLSFANEQLGSDMFRAAGIPTPRVSHAVVRLNGRNLGLYVLKEGFTEDFLSCYFREPGRDLFEPNEGHDVDQHLKRVAVIDHGVEANSNARSSLERLAEAAREPDLGRRWQRLNEVLDVDRFLAFMALEVILGHRDGYCLARNNFRVYQDASTHKWVFLPHGMDQLLGKSQLPWRPRMAGLVANAVLETPDGAANYERVFRKLFAEDFKPNKLSEKLEKYVAPLARSVSAEEFAGIRKEAALVQDRLTARHAELLKQLTRVEPKALEFVNGWGELAGWTAVDAPLKGKMEMLSGDTSSSLHIRTRSDSAASWRAMARLGPGRYQFVGKARTARLEPLPYGHRHGAVLRIGGRTPAAVPFDMEATPMGPSSWQPLAAGFEITNASEDVEFICEFRARAGEAWFDIPSLRVRRLE